MIRVNSIQEVINNLDLIIAWSKSHQTPMGYFATLYRRMTVAVRDGIRNNAFEDGPRMEQLDIIFASRYLDAWESYTHQQRCTNAWYTCFEACSNNKLVVLQHLLGGINAHINLDLGIAAASVAPGEKIFSLQHDFEKINDVIRELAQAIQESLCKIWFPLRALQRITNNSQDTVLNFSITTARKTSWANAVALAFIQGEIRDTHINTIDAAVVTIANRIISPGIMTEMVLLPVREMEHDNVSRNIELLES
ncbi:MAG: DUF5995 family protein [Chitinophagaceae bacterium]